MTTRRGSDPADEDANAVPLTGINSEANDQPFRRQMALFFERSTDAIISLSREYRYTYLNQTARNLLETGGPLLGTDLFGSFPQPSGASAPLLDALRSSMEQGVSTDFETYAPEPIGRWLRVQSYPADSGIMVFFRDVTEERFAAEALALTKRETDRQHAELETLYRTAPIGLALFDVPDFRYVRANERQAAFFGFKPEQLLGQRVTELAPIEGLQALFEQVARGEPVVNFPLEGTLITDPNDLRYWLVSYFPVYGSRGEVEAITAASLEVTQLRKAEKALMESEKLAVVGRLASSIAHEINNPLEAVTNLLYLAGSADTLDETRGFISQAEQELRRAAAITTQTLRFHKQGSSPQAVTDQQLLEGVLLVFHGRLSNSNSRVAERLRATRPVHCFEGEIRQVISNLVGNALDALPATGGRLLLRSRDAHNWATGQDGIALTIADNGAGMSANTLAKVFNAFFTTKGVLGTGLGLWVSQEIVNRHGGTLRVRSSQSPGHHGTVFVLFLPLKAVVR